jgi:MoaA/NifB/PqqE/SkfB family radical SAM enzyme
LRDFSVNLTNLDKLRAEPPSVYEIIRFDPILTCNLHCVYCHNRQSDRVLAVEDFRDFLINNVISTNRFQMGCAMEPTMDPRLTDFMLIIADSPAKPRVQFTLQTNGTLLHRHDYAKMRAAGMTDLRVSVDAAEPETQKILRDGTSLKKVVRNVSGFRAECPEIPIWFVTTVTSRNVEKMETLVSLGIDIGVTHFVFREVFYLKESPVVDHAKIPGLLLQKDDFARMKSRLIERFEMQAHFLFADETFLAVTNRKLAADALRFGEVR